MNDLNQSIERVRTRIETATERAGRRSEDVAVLPITKGHSSALIRSVAEAGFKAIGENRVAEAASKQAEIGRLGLKWHMVGHLQRNKAGSAVGLFDVIESVDSLALGRRLQRMAEREGVDPMTILLQVNASGEARKSGFSPDEMVDVVGSMVELRRLRVEGLMTMAPLTSDARVLRDTFRRTRETLERCRAELREFDGRALSMGMSNDYEIAIEEGSTEVRLGTVLLGPRPGE